MEVPTEAGQPRRFINKAKLLRLLRDSSISRDRPVDRLTKIRRCAERAEAAQAGKASIDGDQLRLHHDYAFAFVENARDQPRLWVGRLVRMVMRKPGLKPQLYARPVDLAGDLTGLELFCNWYEDKGNGCYSLVDAAEDKNPYTVECLLGVVELDYDDSTRSFSMDTKQRESLLAKSRATSHAAASKRTDDAAVAARAEQRSKTQNEAPGLSPARTEVVSRSGRIATKLAPSNTKPTPTTTPAPARSAKAAPGSIELAFAQAQVGRSEISRHHYRLLESTGAKWPQPTRLAVGGTELFMRIVDEARGIAFTPALLAWANKLGFVVDDNTGGRRQCGGTECGIIAANNAVAFAAAGDAWRTLPESALAASASTQQLELAAATAAEWAAAGRHDNVLRRFLGDVEVERLVLSVAARCGVLPLTSKAVVVQTWTKDLFLLHVANDLLCGDSVRRICIVNNEDCDQRGLHYITVVYSVHRSVDSPAARRDAQKLENLKAALEAARLAKRVTNRLESQYADAEELDL